MSKLLWLTTDGSAFYWIPKDAELAAGDLELATLTRQTRSVDAHAAAIYKVDEAATREITENELRRIRASTGSVIRGLDRLKNHLSTASASLRESAAASREATPSSDVDVDPDSLALRLQALLNPLRAAFKPLLDEDAANTEDGLARLERIAAAVRDGGGPDWTGDPESLPRRLRDALTDPALTGGIQKIVETIRAATREARASRGQGDADLSDVPSADETVETHQHREGATEE